MEGLEHTHISGMVIPLFVCLKHTFPMVVMVLTRNVVQTILRRCLCIKTLHALELSIGQAAVPPIPNIKMFLVAVPGILEFVVVELVLPTRDTRQKVVVQQLVMGMVILAAQPIPVAVPVVPVLQLVLLMVFLIVALVLDVQVR